MKFLLRSTGASFRTCRLRPVSPPRDAQPEEERSFRRTKPMHLPPGADEFLTSCCLPPYFNSHKGCTEHGNHRVAGTLNCKNTNTLTASYSGFSWYGEQVPGPALELPESHLDWGVFLGLFSKLVLGCSADDTTRVDFSIVRSVCARQTGVGTLLRPGQDEDRSSTTV